MSEVGEALITRTAELVDVASVSRSEGELAGIVEAELRQIDGLDVVRIGDNVVARTRRERARRLLLAGHLDTVPPAGNERARREGGVLFGVGSTDMKGGLAVLLRLAGTAASRAIDTTYVFYAREEIARTESGLLEIERARPELLAGDAALLLEPTDAVVEAGCLGSLRAEVTVRGVRAHSARPWMGKNAIHRLEPLLAAIAQFGDRRVLIDGCEYRESLQAVGVSGGGVGNVVPDTATLLVNYRFAPDKSLDAAAELLTGLFAAGLDPTAGEGLTLVDQAPGALPNLTDPTLARLVAASGSDPRAKLAWTDVAFFSERGVPATNFGPGDPLLAHRADESVTIEQLEAAYAALDSVIGELVDEPTDASQSRRNTVTTRP